MNSSVKNMAIFASGNGTNAMNILNCAHEELNHTTIKCLITDKADAGIIDKIKNNKLFNRLPIYIIPFERNAGETYAEAKRIHEEKIKYALEDHHVNWITLAGYMRILSEQFIQNYFDEKLNINRVINIHPSLLPKYPGKDAYEQAFDSGDKISGITVHYVDAGVDTGPIILQKKYNRNKEDTLEEFKQRGLNLEYQIYREALVSLDRN
jgi:phosphoribosylglycinamide formyltransferase 1